MYILQDTLMSVPSCMFPDHAAGTNTHKGAGKTQEPTRDRVSTASLRANTSTEEGKNTAQITA